MALDVTGNGLAQADWPNRESFRPTSYKMLQRTNIQRRAVFITASKLNIIGTGATRRLLCKPWPGLTYNPEIQRLFVRARGRYIVRYVTEYNNDCMSPWWHHVPYVSVRTADLFGRPQSIRKGCIVIPICRNSDIPLQFMVKLGFKNKRD